MKQQPASTELLIKADVIANHISYGFSFQSKDESELIQIMM